MSARQLNVTLSTRRRYKSGAHATPTAEIHVDIADDCLYGPYGLNAHQG